MPQAIDLTVKNGATPPVDKNFTLLAPAAGNGGIAEWALKEGSISKVFPRFTAVASPTGNDSRGLKMKLRIPASYQDTVTGLTVVDSQFEINISVAVPNSFPEDKKADAVAFFSNIMSHSLIRAMIRDGLSAT